jgi:hypothetical protein
MPVAKNFATETTAICEGVSETFRCLTLVPMGVQYVGGEAKAHPNPPPADHGLDDSTTFECLSHFISFWVLLL